MSFNAVTFRPRRSNRETISPIRPRCTASGFRRTKVRSATFTSPSSPSLRWERAPPLPPPAPLSAFHLLPSPVEPGLECPSPFRGILPREELRLVDAGDRFGAMLLLRPADDRRVERIARDEVRVMSLEFSSWQVGSDPLVDQVRQVGRDVLSLRGLDRDLHRERS